jgi:hypothetical protein
VLGCVGYALRLHLGTTESELASELSALSPTYAAVLRTVVHLLAKQREPRENERDNRCVAAAYPLYLTGIRQRLVVCTDELTRVLLTTGNANMAKPMKHPPAASSPPNSMTPDTTVQTARHVFTCLGVREPNY